MTDITIGATEHGKLKVSLAGLVDTRLLVQANSGGGKSWLLRLLVERAFKHVQVIILDPEGEFATLREKLDIALVGRDGEIATDLRSASLLARKLVELHIPAVVDLYDLRLHDRRAYVRAFLEALMSVPRGMWHPMLVILDEAHLFAPERSAGDAESTEAVIALMSQGRKRGFAGILSTQRLSKLHKDAAAEANNVMIGRTWLDNDQSRAGDLLGMGKPERSALRDLEAGEFFAFGPALVASGVVRFKSDNVATTHPKMGQRHKLTVPKASDAILEVVKQVGDLPAQAEQEARDMTTLKAENAKLTRELRARPTQTVPEVQERRIEIPVFKDGEVARLEAVVGEVAAITGGLRDASVSLAAVADRFPAALQEVTAALRMAASRPALPMAHPRPAIVTATRQAPPVTRRAAAGAPSNLPRGERAVLEALIQYPDGLRREQLTVLTGYKRSSRDAYLQRLRERGYANTDSDRMLATGEGVAALPDAQPLPRGEALRAFWLARLPQGERVILEALMAAHPEAVDRDDLETSTGYKRSSRDAYLQRLGAKELVVEAGRGLVRASDDLFGE